MKWYPADLDAEPTLRLCSWEAGYLWIKMLGFMHHSPQRGYLLKQSGEPYSEADLVSSIFGATPERIRNCLFELETNAVFSRDKRKIIYCRKMVKGAKRAKNLDNKKSKSGEKTEKSSRKIEDKPDLALAGSYGNERENSCSGDRSVVKPEARSQKPESRKKDRSITTTTSIHSGGKRAAEVGNEISKITGWADDPRWFGDYSRIAVWIEGGIDPELDIYPTVRRIMASRSEPPKTLKFFEGAIADAYAYRTSPLTKGNPEDAKSRSVQSKSARASASIQDALAQLDDNPPS